MLIELTDNNLDPKNLPESWGRDGIQQSVMIHCEGHGSAWAGRQAGGIVRWENDSFSL